VRICPLNVFNQTRALTQNQQCHDLSENTTCIIQTMDGPIFRHFWISFHHTEATKIAPIWRYAGFKCWLDFPSGENHRTFFFTQTGYYEEMDCLCSVGRRLSTAPWSEWHVSSHGAAGVGWALWRQRDYNFYFAPSDKTEFALMMGK